MNENPNARETKSDHERLIGDDAGPHERAASRIARDSGPDVIDPHEWAGRLPQTYGVAPRVRLGSRWVSLLWVLPLVVVALLIAIAVAKGLRETPGVQAFLQRYPGTIMTPNPTAIGIPWWARWQHFFNLFFLMFIIRAGLQILADHPRLYFRS